MRKSVFIALLSATLLLVSCGKEEQTVETNERGVPLTIANIIMGDQYKIDTLYKSQDQVAIHISNPAYTQQIIYINTAIIANSPTLEVDSISQGLYQVSDVLREAKINFANAQSIDKFKTKFPTYPDYSTIAVGDTSTVGQQAIFAFVASVPDDKVKCSDAIRHWIEHSIDDSVAYNSNIREYGQKLEQDFFKTWPKAESKFQYLKSRSMLVYEVTPEYVTYYDFFSSFLGGAHGMECKRFITYSIEDNAPVTVESLIKDDSLDQVRELIYEAIADDEDFMSANRLTSLSQARSYINGYLNGDELPIPDPGLTQEGVVFCYQPYEIGPYAMGSFQLVIPYSRIAPYLK